MQRKSKKILYIFSVIAFLTIGVLIYRYLTVPDRIITNRCINYNGGSSDLVDCYGVISIRDAWDQNYLSIKDHLRNYEIARVYNLNQFTVVGDKIYVKNRQIIERSVSDNANIRYYQEIFQGGKLNTNYYSNLSEIPTYLVIDYKTGEVTAYKNLEETPANERTYFAQLQ